ncbi:hypothetical protein [Lysinibacillus fusiformis]|uniref:hypothetical protein n=1 Tax=Lysinibacillus fusiformis TaxID=28031 RepID=UPI000D3AE693|nr:MULTISPECIES: hypothetical protein [Lysinibacillus]MED4668990.1 hypothetical protein [Lysinibacillus fusiformis]QAS57265.1 hypothetical protein LSP_13400 [Lysinibacillus sphaericus]RDV24966.1 hypothetical protein C7B90_23135 [Lysinibacillus fusiformis]GED63288.1 hypothetical protein LFU01_17400 [Lysinibacillus fusiformis]
MDNLDNDQAIKYYSEEFILNIINDYLVNAFELYDGELIEGLSFTMHNVKVIYDNGKYRAITLYVVMYLLETLVFEKINYLYSLDEKDWLYWKEKLYILFKENEINTEELEREVIRSIKNNLNEIVNYISEFRNDNNLLY